MQNRSPNMLVTQPNTGIARIQYYGSDSYRNQGQEKDDEVKGRGNSYDFGARMYDARLGRWLTIDPLEKKYPESSAYVFSINSPILFKDADGRDWILYTGSKIIYYDGDPGDKTTVLKVYRATSGHKGFQNSAHQYVKNDGPIPAGKYVIDLQPDPTRRNKFNSNGTTTPSSGIEIMDWEQGLILSGWGQWRARLMPKSGTITKGRNNFYLHDSYKGESSGCIECETDLYYDLVQYREEGNKSIEVWVEYPSSNTSTNGGTEESPRPWQEGSYEINGTEWPYPAPNSFPSENRMPSSANNNSNENQNNVEDLP